MIKAGFITTTSIAALIAVIEPKGKRSDSQ